MRRYFLVFAILNFLIYSQSAEAQRGRGRDNTVVYEELYDEPYDLNKLWILFQPIYGELFVTNINVGFGLEAHYLWEDKAQFRLIGRKAYTRTTDFERDVAENLIDREVSNVQLNDPQIFNYYEFGFTYHIKDFEKEAETKMILLRSKEDHQKLRAKVPEQIKIPSKRRIIYGARLGGITYSSTTDLDKVLRDDDITLPAVDPMAPIPMLNGNDPLFTNVTMYGIYLGGQFTQIKNFAVKPDRTFGTLVNDLIFSAYLDIIYAPSVDLEDVILDDGSGGQVAYSVDPLSTSSIGFRAGMEGKFNREWSWAYNAEIGFRPSIESRGFYALVKISFPAFSTPLNFTKEAFGK